jgi:hypothetical protein
MRFYFACFPERKACGVRNTFEIQPIEECVCVKGRGNTNLLWTFCFGSLAWGIKFAFYVFTSFCSLYSLSFLQWKVGFVMRLGMTGLLLEIDCMKGGC